MKKGYVVNVKNSLSHDRLRVLSVFKDAGCRIGLEKFYLEPQAEYYSNVVLREDHKVEEGFVYWMGEGRFEEGNFQNFEISADEFLKLFEEEDLPDNTEEGQLRRIGWNEDVTLTVPAYEIVRVLAASGGTSHSGLKNSIYEFAEETSGLTRLHTEGFYKKLQEGGSCFLWSIADNVAEKQELVDEIFNRNYLRQVADKKVELINKRDKLKKELIKIKEEINNVQ